MLVYKLSSLFIYLLFVGLVVEATNVQMPFFLIVVYFCVIHIIYLESSLKWEIKDWFLSYVEYVNRRYVRNTLLD